MSEPITHIDTDNYMTIHHKGASYFDPAAYFGVFCSLILKKWLSFIVIIAYMQCNDLIG